MRFPMPKTITKLLLLIGMVAFFFPFVMVSCSGESMELSGFELMTSISLRDEMENEEEGEDPNPYLAVAFICGAIAFGATWFVRGSKEYDLLVPCAFSAVGAVFLIIFRLTFWEFYELTEFKGRVDLRFRWGWILSIISYAGSAALALLAYRCNKTGTNWQISTAQHVSGGTPSVDHKSEPSGENRQADKTVVLLEDNSCPPSALRVHITCLAGADAYQEWDLSDFPCVIGRNASIAQVVITDSRISGIHAKLALEGDAVMISDAISSNGTFVNGEKITVPTELLTGDTVVIGETELYIEVGI